MFGHSSWMTTHLELAKLLEATLTPFGLPVQLDQLMQSLGAEGGHAGPDLTPVRLPASGRRQIQSIRVQNLQNERARFQIKKMRARQDKAALNREDFDPK